MTGTITTATTGPFPRSVRQQRQGGGGGGSSRGFVTVRRVAYRDNRNDHLPRRWVHHRSTAEARTKQISHESTSSFFTHATTLSSNYEEGEEEQHRTLPSPAPPRQPPPQVAFPQAETTKTKTTTTTPSPEMVGVSIPTLLNDRTQSLFLLPDVPEEDHESEASSGRVTPVQIVFTFLQLVREGNIADASRMLDDEVRVSYLGRPFCESVTAWTASQRKRDNYNNENNINEDAWQSLQPGAHEHQVVRKGRLANGIPVIEVFELHTAPWTQKQHDRETLCIGAIYQRRLPKQWITGLLVSRRQQD